MAERVAIAILAKAPVAGCSEPPPLSDVDSPEDLARLQAMAWRLVRS
jgi:glycosyltransferase A (GT-A) superfamily protein (DUF2064 family)